jgi:hypothetical protein
MIWHTRGQWHKADKNRDMRGVLPGLRFAPVGQLKGPATAFRILRIGIPGLAR